MCKAAGLPVCPVQQGGWNRKDLLLRWLLIVLQSLEKQRLELRVLGKYVRSDLTDLAIVFKCLPTKWLEVKYKIKILMKLLMSEDLVSLVAR